jgi:hypothetical protein
LSESQDPQRILDDHPEIVGYQLSGQGTSQPIAGLQPVKTPEAFTLAQNYPNPFNPSTHIQFDLPQDSFVTLKVYDINGRVVTTLLESPFTAGSHVVEWNGSQYASGVYFYNLKTNVGNATKQMILVK